ncbi:MAG: phage tail protein, partial [Sulfuricella sp.]
IVVTDEHGQIKEQRVHKNLVVTAGKAWIAARMKATGAPAEMTHMAVGTGSTAAADANTALGTESARVSLSSAVSGAVVTYTASFPAGTGTAALTEAGIFNASSAGTMLCRTVFPVVNKGASDSMAITWTVTVG